MNEETREIVKQTLADAIVAGLEVEVVCSMLESMFRYSEYNPLEMTVIGACQDARMEWDI